LGTLSFLFSHDEILHISDEGKKEKTVKFEEKKVDFIINILLENVNLKLLYHFGIPSW
jgi:hypothetical protein